MVQTKADLHTFNERVGRINKGKTVRPDGVLTSQRDVDAAMAKQSPKKSGKDFLFVPLALGLGVVTVLIGTFAGPTVADLVLSKWPDASALLAAVPPRIAVSVAFGLLAIILFNLATAKRQMAFSAGAAVTYFGGMQALGPIGEQMAALQTFI